MPEGQDVIDPTQMRHPAEDLRSDPAVCGPHRTAAPDRSGPAAAPDPELDRLADWVRSALDVPVALISPAHPDGPVLPGAAGPDPSWPGGRATPLTRSLCREVVATAAPVVVRDARAEPVTRDRPADPEVIAYAGMPLVDAEGDVLGTLCAVDRRPRVWTDAELDTLGRIADACRSELQLRMARRDAARERRRRDDAEQAQRRAFDRSQILLTASQAFTDTVTVADVRAQVHALLAEALDPAYVSVLVADDRGWLHHHDVDARRPGPAPLEAPVRPGSGLPAADAVERRRLLHYPDRECFDLAHPAPARDQVRAAGLHCVVAAPLPSATGPLGALVLGWTTPRAVDPTGLLIIATLAGYAAQALGRAQRLLHRSTVASDMQRALLTVLPAVPGLALAARYAPGDSREYVGGDWYDVTPMRDPGHPEDLLVGVSVGDIIGHALPAVSLMGHTRSMLRQAGWDRAGRAPSAALEAFEGANTGLGIGAAGTALLAHLRRNADEGWTLTWTNAGHPPPILLHPDGSTDIPAEHDPLFGFSLTGPGERADHRRRLHPGTIVFLYTDGLVERRGRDMDEGTAALVDLLGELRDGTPEDIVTTAVDTLAPHAEDDVVAFAVRIDEPADRP